MNDDRDDDSLFSRAPQVATSAWLKAATASAFVCIGWMLVVLPSLFSLSRYGVQACQLKSSSWSVQRFNSESNPPHPNATVRRAGCQKMAESFRALLGSHKQSWILMQALGHAKIAPWHATMSLKRQVVIIIDAQWGDR